MLRKNHINTLINLSDLSCYEEELIMSNEFIQILLGLAIVLVGSAGAYAISTIASFYKSKRDQLIAEIETSNIIKYSKIARDAVYTVDEIIGNVVNELDDTVKKEILASTEDGKLTDEEKTKLKDMAIELINKEVSESIKDFATSIVGDLDSYISTVIENKVTQLKADKDDDIIFSLPECSYESVNDNEYISQTIEETRE